MIRLTLLLIAGLFAVMSIWGDPLDDDVVVARADSFAPTVAEFPTDTPPATPAKTDLSALSESEALNVALAAGSADEPEPVAPVASTVRQEEQEADDALILYVTGSRVNLRNGPTTNSAIVGSVALGDRAEVLTDPADSWVRIRTDSGVEAWIYGRFLAETPS